MVNEFCGFKHGVIGTDKMPADTTLNNMKKADLIKLLHTAQHNYETLMYFYNNAVKVNMSQLNNNGWIPCSERLPKKDGSYLVCSKNGNVYREHYYCDYSFRVLNSGTGWGHSKQASAIIAWMPLPEPYKEGGQK